MFFRETSKNGQEKVYSFSKLTLLNSPSHNDKVGIYSNGPTPHTERERVLESECAQNMSNLSIETNKM